MNKVFSYLNQPLVAVVLLAGLYLGYQHFVAHPAGPVNPAQVDVADLGKQFAGELVKNHAKSCKAVAASIRAGQKYGDALKSQTDQSRTDSRTAFLAKFQEPLSEIIPEGSEPTTDRQRQALAKFYDDLAEGELKGVK
ncbi:hypothetical protein [Singulisphaera sp. PoT]|uniref:hypothetical protein n=1 Tax=Singulisphaera sp. PoT TaxID=3411797 RepID=UPI003BF4665D